MKFFPAISVQFGTPKVNLSDEFRNFSLQKTRNFPASTQAATGNSPQYFVQVYRGGVGSSAVSVTQENALSLSTMWAAVRNISEDIAKLEFNVYTIGDNDKKTRDYSHIAYKLMQLDPNPSMGAMSCKQAIIANAIMHGNGYAVIGRNPETFEIETIWPIHPFAVNPYVCADGTMKYIVLKSQYNYSPYEGVFEDYEIMHITGFSLDGFNGLSLLKYAANTLGVAISQQEYTGEYYKNGLSVSGAIEYPNALTEVAYNRLTESLNDTFSGQGNRGKVIPLDNGAKFNPINSISAADAEIVASKAFSKEEIATLMRTPQHTVGIMAQATNNNIEQQGMDYVYMCLYSWIIKFEQECHKKLVREADKPFTRCKINYKILITGDMAARGEYYSKMVTAGVFTRNEIRNEEDWNDLDGLDSPFVPVNSIPLTEYPKYMEHFGKPATKAAA